MNIAYRTSIQGGEQVRREITSIGDTAEAQEARIVRVAEARARKLAEAERTVAAVRAESEKARAKADIVLGGPGSLAKYQDEERMFAAMRQQSALLQKEQQQAASDAHKLLAAIDPLYAAQSRYNAEIAEANRLYRAGALSVDQFTIAQRHAKAALDATTAAQQRNGVSTGQARAASMNLGYQIQDVTQQIALGTAPMMIFAQQSGQVTQALGAMGVSGALGRVLAFLSGPWGAVITGGAMILAMFATRTKEASDASNKQKDALDFQKQSVRELIASIDDLARAQRQQTLTAYENEIQARKSAEAALLAATTKRTQAMAELELAKAQAVAAYEASVGGRSANYGGMAVAQQKDSEVARIQAEINRLSQSMDAAGGAVRAAQIPISDRRLKEATDAQAAAEGKLERAKAKANEEFRKGDIMQAERDRRVASAMAAYEAQTKAIQDQTKAVKERGEIQQFIKPVDGPVTSGFGPRNAPTKGASSFHRAIDFGVPTGTAVRASADGYIEIVGYSPGYGKYIVINHGAGTKTRYNHLSDTLGMSKGDAVTQGQTVARSGNTGTSTGPHLDFQVLRNGQPVNPGAMRFPIGQLAIDKAAAKDAADQVKGFESSLESLTSKYDQAAAAQADFLKDVAMLIELEKAGQIGIGAKINMGSMATAKITGQKTPQQVFDELAKNGGDPVADNVSVINKGFEDRNERAKRAAEWAAEENRSSGERIKLLEKEIDLVGASDRVREDTILREQTILELARYGVTAETERGREILANRQRIADMERALAKAQSIQDDFERIGEGAIDRIFDPNNWKNWGDMGKQILKELLQQFLILAAVNPLKNLANGSDLPTLGDLFSSGGVSSNSGAVQQGSNSTGNAIQAGIQFLGSFLGGNAMGTENWRGGLTWVGENGRELVNLPSGSKITPAAQTRRILNANDNAQPVTTINQSINVTGAVDLATKTEVYRLAEATHQMTMQAFADQRKRAA